MVRRAHIGLGLLGVFSVGVLAFGVGGWLFIRATSEPGAMARAYGELISIALTLFGIGVLVWVVREIARSRGKERTLSLMITSVGSVIAVVAAVLWSQASLRAEHEEARALQATAPWRQAFRDDLIDAFRDWSHETGRSQTFYTGDFSDHWSLDPDGDGEPDPDPPILRVLERAGWAERGVSVADIDGDSLVDILEWSPPVGETWCVPVTRHEETGLVGAKWRRAFPGSCSE